MSRHRAALLSMPPWLRRLAAILLLLGLSPLVSTERASACLCGPIDPMELFEEADAVFAGRVTADGESAGRPAEFRVARVWKGSDYAIRFVGVGGVIRPDGLVTVTSCDPQFRQGEEYLVYAYRVDAGEPLQTSYCGIAWLGHAQAHLDALREGRLPRTGTAAVLGNGGQQVHLDALGVGRPPRPGTIEPPAASDSANIADSLLTPWTLSIAATAAVAWAAVRRRP